jgi:hypothetical protein
VENYLIVGSVLYKSNMRKTVIFLDEAWLQYSDTKILVQFLVSTNFSDYLKLIPKQLCGELTEEETVGQAEPVARGPHAACKNVMLPTETYVMRKPLLTIPLRKTR